MYIFCRAIDTKQCEHAHLTLLNDPDPALVCVTCNARWTLTTKQYGPPLIVALERCGMCDEPVDLRSDGCALHELRAAACECASTQDDSRIGRAALRYTSAVLKLMPMGAISRTTAEILRQAIKMLERMGTKD